MRKSSTPILALILALAVALPASAAARAVAPPGNSEADQYFETLPGSAGPRAPDPARRARDAVRDGALGEATEGALRGRGPAGLALADAVAQTAPPRTLPGRPGGAPPPPAGALGRPGLGAAFPLALGLAAAAALAFALTRRRRPLARPSRP